MKVLLTILLFLTTQHLSAQQISGTMLDDKKEPVINASVIVYQLGLLKDSAFTDFDGKYAVKPLDPGCCYTAVAISLGYDTAIVTDIIVNPNGTSWVDLSLVKSGRSPKCMITKFRKPLLDDRRDPREKSKLHGDGGGRPTILIDVQVTDLVSTPVVVYQQKRGGTCGATFRDAETKVIIDGVVVRGTNIENWPDFIEPPTYTKYGSGNYILNHDQIAHMPAGTIEDMLTLLPGAWQRRRGEDVQFFGNR